MSTFVDRRLNPRDKHIRNRQRLIQRNRNQIKRVIKKIIEDGNVEDIDEGKIKIKVKGVSEPTFHIDPKTGDRKNVFHGNEDFVVGDTLPKPDDDASEGGPRGSRHGRGNDDFEFLLSEKEFVDFLFEELELPHMIKKKMKTLKQVTFQKAGFKNYGTPNQLDIVRSLKNSLGRRIGLKRPTNEQIQDLEALMNHGGSQLSWEEREELYLQIEEMKRRQIAIPWIDPFDVKYRAYVPQPKPITQAVMFCLMDISASMGEREKDIAKRFFILLHLFLKRKYEKIVIVFIAHHSEAMEVDEHEFFHGTETGGTVVSTSLALANKILNERFKKDDWNIYIAQCSDGGNVSDDDVDVNIQMNKLLPQTQYFAYMEISTMTTFNYGITTDLWKCYKLIEEKTEQMCMKLVYDKSGVWNVFRELFAKEAVNG